MSGKEKQDKLKLTPFGPYTNLTSGERQTNDFVTLDIQDAGLSLSNWTSYQFSSDWMETGSEWHVTVADGNMQALQALVQNGQKIVFKVNGVVQCTGLVDRISSSSSKRGGGTTFTMSGRDTLSVAKDMCIDMDENVLSETTSIKDLIIKVFSPYGFTNVQVSDKVNRGKITQLATVYVDTGADELAEKQISVPTNKKWKPVLGETNYTYAERIGRRFGFHIWSSAEGNTLFCGSPDYTTPAVGQLIHRNEWMNSGLKSSGLGEDVTDPSKASNVLSAEVVTEWSKQPTILLAESSLGGGTKKYARRQVIMVNELLTSLDASGKEPPFVQKFIAKHKAADVIPRRSYVKKPDSIIDVDTLRLVVVKDDESKTLEHLRFFARSSMSRLQSQAFKATYVVQGHSQEIDGRTHIWAPNTMVNVHDDANGVYGQLWIKSVSFHKDRSGGTTTTLNCILPYTIELFPDDQV